MSDVVLIDMNVFPDDEVLISILGPTFKYYIELKTYITQTYSDIKEEWKYYGQKHGWQLKIFYKKRNLLFIIPCKTYFKVVFIFGDRAVEKIELSDVKEELKAELRSARKYAEGRGLPIEVKDEVYLENIKKLVEIKYNN